MELQKIWEHTPIYIPAIIWMTLQQLGESNRHQRHSNTHLSSSKSWGFKPWFGSCWLNSEPQHVTLGATILLMTLGFQAPTPSWQRSMSVSWWCMTRSKPTPHSHRPALWQKDIIMRVNHSGGPNSTLDRVKISPPAMCPRLFVGHNHHGASVSLMSVHQFEWACSRCTVCVHQALSHFSCV